MSGGGGDAVVVGHIAVSCAAAAAAASALRRTRNPGALSRRVESRTVSALSVSDVCFVVFLIHDYIQARIHPTTPPPHHNVRIIKYTSSSVKSSLSSTPVTAKKTKETAKILKRA